MSRRPDRNEMLLEAGLALSSELSLDAVLQRIVELAAAVTDASYGALGVLGPEGRIEDFITTGISQEQRNAIGRLPVGRGVLGVLISEPRPLRLPDVSKHSRSIGFPPNHPPMKSFLGAPVKAKGKVFGNLYLTEKQGAQEFDEEDERALLVLATQAGVAIENARLYEEARQRERRLDGVREIATTILERGDPRETLELVARRARELVGADVATIATPNAEGEGLTVRVADGLHAERLRGMSFGMAESVSGEVMRTHRPVVLDDAAADQRAYQPVISTAEIGPAMFVPLSSAGRAFGTLAVANRRGGPRFVEEDLSLVETFARQASVALEFARVQGELRRLAVLDDRERIAKELHDGAIQSLFAVGMGLQAAAQISGDPNIEKRLASAAEEVDRVIRDLRNYIFGLRPGILVDRQLDQALRQLAEEFEGRSGVTTAVEIDGEVAAELASRAGDLIQLAREALSNVGRHAGAATCRLSLIRRNGVAMLEIDDDGRGFDLAAQPGKGLGLPNLRERAASLGGELSIDSTPGEGTTVRISIPI